MAPIRLAKWVDSAAKLLASSISLPAPPAWLEALLAARELLLETRAVPRPRVDASDGLWEWEGVGWAERATC